MKNTKSLLCLSATALLLAGILIGCGNGPEPAAAAASVSDPPANDPTPTSNVAPGTHSAEPAAPEPTPETAVASKPATPITASVDVTTLTSGEPVNAAVLRDAVVRWVGQSVLIGGYPWLDGDEEGSFGMRVTLVPAPTSGEAEQIVECWPKDTTRHKVTKSTPVVVAAKIRSLERRGTDPVRLDDCRVVSVGEAFDSSVAADPKQPVPIPLNAFNQAVYALNGQKVTVEGYLKGSSTSRLKDGTVTEVELQERETDGLGEAAVSCRLAGNGEASDLIPPAALDQRAGTVMTGTIEYKTGMTDRVYLKDCEFVNR